MDVVRAGEAVGAGELDAGDEDGGEVGRRGCLQQIGCYIEFFVGGKVDASFVEEGVFASLGG